MIPVAGVLSFAVTFVVIRVLLSRFGDRILDRPNERSLHVRPVPRTGGIALMAGVVAGATLGDAELWIVVVLALALAAVSMVDDFRGLPAGARLGGHLIAAAIAVWYLVFPLEAVLFVLLVISVAWITNLYNFMDGSDGLAGGMAAFGFSTYAIAAYAGGGTSIQLVGTSVACAALAFLAFNFHPARIFLGDAGSIPLGFLAAVVGLWGWRDDLWPLWFPLLVFGPFVGDATITLLRRLLRGEKIWRAHREHYYQRMVRMGLGHRAAALIAYAAMLVCSACALTGRTQPPVGQAIAFLLASLCMAGVAVWVDLRWSRQGERAA